MIKRQVEVLAPAGSYESMKAAVNAGADAVYIGGSRFGARAFADNPDEDRLMDAIDYVHLHGRKLYMTVNTLMKQQEMQELYAYLLPYYRRGLDAVIVQDLGVFSFIRNRFPDLPIHASTQMTITGVHGARLLKEMGAERIVTARELSLEEIAAISREVDVEIESFVHGALCYCYSGQCLFSSLIGGRSGNRGRCAQTCRLPFDVKRDGRQLNQRENRYVLSLKDLCTLDLIPDMIEAGIGSMKIEGRMKSPRYTAGVVSVYRTYVDRYLAHGRSGYAVEEEDRKMLLDLFDRGGQTDGYYKRHNGRNMVVWKEKPAFREGNEALFQYLDQTYVDKELKESVVGTALIESGQPARLKLQMGDVTAEVTGKAAEEAKKQPMDAERIRIQLEKTGNTPFEFQQLHVDVKGSVFLPVQALNELRRSGIEALQNQVLSSCWREEPDNLLAEASLSGKGGSQRQKACAFAGFSVALERPDCLQVVIEHGDVKRIYLDAAEFPAHGWGDAVQACHQAGKECMLTLPHIFRREAEQFFHKREQEFLAAGFDGVLVRSLEEVDFIKNMMARGEVCLPMVFDYGMYGMNEEAQKQLLALGAAELTWPVELNGRELERLPYEGELIVYGRLPMMVTAQCVHQGTEGCDQVPGILWLKDRIGKEFPVKNHCTFCYNTIYNTEPLSLLGLEGEVCRTNPARLRLQFTTESVKETAAVIQCFTDRYYRKGAAELPFVHYTRGHFKRGVE